MKEKGDAFMSALLLNFIPAVPYFGYFASASHIGRVVGFGYKQPEGSSLLQYGARLRLNRDHISHLPHEPMSLAEATHDAPSS